MTNTAIHTKSPDYFPHLLTYYPRLSLATKAYLWLRWFSAPFVKTEMYLPSKGVLVDIGCGTGIFDLYLVLKSGNRTVIGIEPDPQKYATAISLNSHAVPLHFHKGFFKAGIIKHKADAIIIFDVFYLLPPSQKEAILKLAKQILKPTGKIYLKTIRYSLTPGFLLGYIQEIISVGLSKMTFSQTKKLYFYSPQQYKDLFHKTGFNLEKTIPLHTMFFHPHILYILTSNSQRK